MAISNDGKNVVRFGIIGCAEIAKKYVRAVKYVSDAEICALGSRSLDKARKFANEVELSSNVKLYDSYQGVVDDPLVDVVYIPLPTSLHLEWVTKAAQNGKHVHVEKPISLSDDDLKGMLKACKDNGVQLMDGTMWVHNPRATAMKQLIESKEKFGAIRRVYSSFGFCGDEDFLQNDIRVKPDLDGLGCLGDVGWYCIRAALWAKSYELPEYVVAQVAPKRNQQGVLINCGASLIWSDGCIATFDCGFDTNLQQTFIVSGSKGTLEIDDFVIPEEEASSSFKIAWNCAFAKGATAILKEHKVVKVGLEIPQESFMVQKMASIVRGIKEGSGTVDESWIHISRATQLAVNAVAKSFQSNFAPVELSTQV